MISGGCALIFGVFAVVLGIAFIWLGVTEPYLSAIIVGIAALAYGYFAIRNSLAWMRIRPAESLTLFDDHFCIGSDQFPYGTLKDIKVHRIRTRKTLNFLPAGVDETVITELEIGGRLIQLRAGTGPATILGPSLGRPATDKFLRTLELLKFRSSQMQRSEAPPTN